jgi:hypothetical protein
LQAHLLDPLPPTRRLPSRQFQKLPSDHAEELTLPQAKSFQLHLLIIGSEKAPQNNQPYHQGRQGDPSPPQIPSIHLGPRSKYTTPLISTPPPAHLFIPPTDPSTSFSSLPPPPPFHSHPPQIPSLNPPTSPTSLQLANFNNLRKPKTDYRTPLLSLSPLPTNENHSTRSSLTSYPFPLHPWNTPFLFFRFRVRLEWVSRASTA